MDSVQLNGYHKVKDTEKIPTQGTDTIDAANILTNLSGLELYKSVKGESAGQYKAMLSGEAAKQSLYAKLLQTYSDKKAVEEAYRNFWSSNKTSMTDILKGKQGKVFSIGSLENSDRMEHAEDFEHLISCSKSVGTNSELYNNVIIKAEIFHQLEKRGTRNIDDLARAALELNEACDAYISKKHPRYDKGKERKKAVIREKELATRVYEAIYKRDSERAVKTTANYIFDNTQQDGDVGEIRHNRLMESVKCMINSWIPVGDEFKNHPHLDNLVDTLKAKMLDDTTIQEKMMIHFFPQLKSNERANIALQKKVLKSTSETQLKSFMDTFIRALYETMGDIVYWGLDNNVNANAIDEFNPTASDLHARGLGVCIVTYGTTGAPITKVIKPEVKLLEYELLSSRNPESLANKFNNQIRINGKRLSECDPPVNGIKTLDLQISDHHGTMVEYVDHVRKASQKEIDAGNTQGRLLPDHDYNKIDHTQAQLTQIFCTMIGMGDMHTENLVYYHENADDPLYKVAMIDADNAMDFQKMDIEALQTGFMDNYFHDDKNLINKFSFENKEAFINKYLDILMQEKVVCRTVPITSMNHGDLRDKLQEKVQDSTQLTKWLDTLYTQVLENIGEFSNQKIMINKLTEMYRQLVEQDKTDEGAAKQRMLAIIIEVVKMYAAEKPDSRNPCSILTVLGKTDANKRYTGVSVPPTMIWNAAICAAKDYLAGTIPFYEFHPSTGIVTTHKDTDVATIDTSTITVQAIDQETPQDRRKRELREYYKSILTGINSIQEYTQPQAHK